MLLRIAFGRRTKKGEGRREEAYEGEVNRMEEEEKGDMMKIGIQEKGDMIFKKE